MTPACRRFHPLRVAAIDPLTDDAVALTFEVPAELRDDYAFARGQHVSIRGADDDAPQLLDLHAAVVRAAADRGEAAAGRSVQRGRPRRLRVGDELDVMTPAGRFTTDARPDAREALRRRRRRVGHHAGALDRRRAARGRAGLAGDAGLRQPDAQHR